MTFPQTGMVFSRNYMDITISVVLLSVAILLTLSGYWLGWQCGYDKGYDALKSWQHDNNRLNLALKHANHAIIKLEDKLNKMKSLLEEE